MGRMGPPQLPATGSPGSDCTCNIRLAWPAQRPLQGSRFHLDSRLRFGHTSPEKGHTVVFYFLLLLLLLLLWVGQSPRPYSRKRNLDLQPSGEGCRIQPASCVRVGPIPRRGCHELVVAPGLPALCGRDVRYRSEMNQNKRQEVAMTNSHRHGCGAGA